MLSTDGSVPTRSTKRQRQPRLRTPQWQPQQMPQPQQKLQQQACIDAANASVEATYTDALAAIPNSPGKTEGIAVGQAAAAAILAKRTADSSNGGPFLNTNCPQDTQPGKYRCTNKFVAFEKWADVTPFVLEDNTQFRPGPPYSVTDKMFADDYKEVKSLGGDGINTPSSRTDDQTAIGLFCGKARR